MEKLIEKFNTIVRQSKFSSLAEIALNSGKLHAEECKKVAIAFATYLLERKLTKYTKGTLNEELKEELCPVEYQLLLGEIIRDKDNIFNIFIQEEYE